ncbi:M16 family metallopeptidase [Candidatus Moduliflexota bacterium]
MRAQTAFPALAAALSILAGCAATTSPDPRTMSFPAVKFDPPEHRRLVQPNGTVLYLLEDHEVPLVNIQVLVRTGSVLDPVDKPGLAEMTGRVMRTGGTADHRPDRLNEKLEDMGALLETSIGREAGHASLSVLTSDLEEGVGLLAAVLRTPLFAEEEVARAARRKIEQLRRSNDDPDTIAFRELRAVLYGDDPRGRTPEPEDISALIRSDLAAFHRRYFHPDRIIVGVTGDFVEGSFLRLWEREFGDWEPAGGEPGPLPVPRSTPPTAVYLASRDFPQTTIALAQFAPPLGSPDYFSFLLMNYILGGAGFNSRLTGEIRSNRGLAYSVGSSYRGGVGYGVLAAWCKTGPGTAPEALGLMVDVMDRVRREGVTGEELEWAKESIVNSLIFSIDGPAEVLSRRMSHEYDGLPPDFLERYPDLIGAVTAADVGRAAAGYLRPESAPVVVVGRNEGQREAFADFGETVVVPLREY